MYDLLLHYFNKFGDKSVSYDDISNYLDLMDQESIEKVKLQEMHEPL